MRDITVPKTFWKDYTFWSIILFLATLLAYLCFYGLPVNVFTWDTWGYYLYLPQTFIEGDVVLSNQDSLDYVVTNYNPNNSSYLYQLHAVGNGNFINQYWCGVAFLSAPFFFIGHYFAWVFEYPMDGYSWPYQLAFIIGNYTYMVLGILVFRKALMLVFNHKIAALMLLIVCLGTNYFYIHLYGLGMTHVYLFPLYALVLYSTLKWHLSEMSIHLFVGGITIALIILIRPVDGLIVLIPLLWNVTSFELLKQNLLKFLRHKKTLALTFICASAIISLQLIYFYLTTGSLFVNSYSNPEESLYLDDPHVFDFLLSWRKGWFIYTPIMFLILPGFYYLRKYKKPHFLPIILFTVLFIYVSASWSTWWYGYSFSQRTMIQTYPILAIPLGVFLVAFFRTKLRVILVSIGIFMLCALNLFQTIQFKKGILHGSRMTFAAYLDIFGELEKRESTESKLLIDHDNVDFNPDQHERGNSFNDIANEVSHLNTDTEYSTALNIPYSSTSNDYYAWYKIEFDYYFHEDSDSTLPMFVGRFWNKNRWYGTRQFLISDNDGFEKEKWCHANIMYLTPTIRRNSDHFEGFVWGRKEEISIKNLKMTAFTKIN